MNPKIISGLTILVICAGLVLDGCLVHGAQDFQDENLNKTISKEKRLFSYAGSFLPADWMVVTIVNERAVIGFTNESARNTLLVDLDPRDRQFLEKLQNGTIYTTPLTSAKEKIAQWSSSVSSTVSKFGKSVRDQFDSFINNKKQDNNSTSPSSSTTINITEHYITN